LPTSFSRILNEADLAEVREQYLAALEALEAEEAAAPDDTEPDPAGPAQAVSDAGGAA
jgi:hypothetical protein